MADAVTDDRCAVDGDGVVGVLGLAAGLVLRLPSNHDAFVVELPGIEPLQKSR